MRVRKRHLRCILVDRKRPGFFPKDLASNLHRSETSIGHPPVGDETRNPRRGQMYKKVTSLQVPVSPEVASFAVVMEAKLQMEGYDQVESWQAIPLEKLLAQLKVKTERLAATDPSNPFELFTKSVVIGNLAMMIAEKSAQMRERAEEAVAAEAQKTSPTPSLATVTSLPNPPSRRSARPYARTNSLRK